MYNPNWRDEYFHLLNNPPQPSLALINKAVELRNKFLPQSLYRYERFSAVDSYALDNLRNAQVFLNSPSEFNDPFDSVLSALDNNLMSGEFSRSVEKILSDFSIMLNAEEKDHIRLSSQPLNVIQDIVTRKKTGHEDEINSELNLIKMEYYALWEENWSKRIRGCIRVSCFTEVFDSILMWSHYADKHQGFCIKYDSATMKRSDTLGTLHPVNYSREVFDATPHLLAFGENRLPNIVGVLAACSKAPDWSYEKEWRLVSIHGDLFCPLPAQSIIVGARISQENEGKLREVARYLEIPVLRARLAPREFKIIADSA